MVDPHRLTVFRAVVQTGSINRAATRLGYTASAVSQHVSALQRETGLTLVERRGRGIVPTAAGVAVAERAARVLDHLADFDGVVDDLRTGRTGTVRIGTFSSANRAWLPQVVAALAREFPQLRLELTMIELRGQLTGDPDIELYVAESVRADRDPSAGEGVADAYDLEELRGEGYVVVVPAGHALAGRTEVGLAELADEPWIDNDHSRGPCREIVMASAATAGFAPRFRIQAPDYTSAFDYVATGVGVTVLPRLGAIALPPGTVMIPITDAAARRRIMMRVKRTMRTNPAVHRASELLRAASAA
ncbi:DNA-binding transcriptional regulator, LysR family [Agromyces sp. CF514]|uniref:LysR family transcriptional regulator n=1 Tax=Agromyces sp. CF514 TaxID=1881031 RepID=UPI0008E0CBE2|nr:LysR family transcriptional regulator [Agromyces sp. CF514]SFR74936.1 DNA-binding transcriptional regulator, LysR family [Agromyces sp. CF514]